jgi:hypothetical protein
MKMSSEIYNVKIDIPIDHLEWLHEAQLWNNLKKEISFIYDCSPLTIKLLYVIGVIIASCRSIEVLLKSGELPSTVYFPAYTVFSSIIDLLGRCLRGNTTYKNSSQDLYAGFKWLAQPIPKIYDDVPLNYHLIKTTTPWGSQMCQYTITELTALRNFAAHGQSNAIGLPAYDMTILGKFTGLLAQGIEEYINSCENNSEICSFLAKANIQPYRNRPLFDTVWEHRILHDRFAMSVGEYIRGLNWKIRVIPIKLSS